MKFESLEINQCLNKECNQKFTLDNIKLAVWLHGVILLAQKNPPTADPLLPLVSVPDEKTEDFNPQGYVGLTCPKCLETSLYQGSYQDILNFKEQLKTMVSLSGNDPDELSSKLEHDLRYYAPYGIGSENYEQFDIKGYFFDNSKNDFDYLQSDLQIYITDEISDSWMRLCSYVETQDVPAGFCTYIYWFQEEQIFELLKFEKEHGVRIFPRYHYITDLVRKIDSLSKYNYESDYFINEARRQHEFQEEKRFEDYRKSLRAKKTDGSPFNPMSFEDFLAEKQSPLINAPKLTGDFLDVLISEPKTLVDITNNAAGNCNYLWSTIEPFEGEVYPEVFPTDSDVGIKQDDLKKHNKIVVRVQENYTKQYAQDFLKTGLVNFLKEYERTLQANDFSYADIWQLKESHLEGLYNAVNTGLRNEVPYAMYRQGTSWKIVFNGKSFGGLRGKGFLWIYLTIFHKPSPVYYSSLHDTYEAKLNEANEDQVAGTGSQDKRTIPRRKGYTDFEQESYRTKTMEDMKNTGQVSISYSGVLTKQFYADVPTLKKYQKKLDEIEGAIEKARQSGDIDRLDEAMSDEIKFLDELKKNSGIRKVKVAAKPGERDYKLVASKFKDDRYETIRMNIQKNYRNALEILEGIKDAKDLHAHLSKSILKEGGAFIYKPAEDIVWHLD